MTRADAMRPVGWVLAHMALDERYPAAFRAGIALGAEVQDIDLPLIPPADAMLTSEPEDAK